MPERFRILVHCSEPVAPPRLTGPVVRGLAFARALGKRFDTWVAAPPGSVCEMPGEPFELRTFTRSELVREMPHFDLVVSQGMFLPARATLARRPAWVFDLYDPVFLEARAAGVSDKELRHLRRFTNLLLGRADLVTCASRQQRDLWTGALAALGRFDAGSREDLVQIVPFGHDGSEPQALSNPVMKGAIQGIASGDKVLLWGGGVWDWFDPLTLIRAVSRLSEERGDVRLVFLAGPRPGGIAEGRGMLGRARSLARELSAEGRCVFFHEEWVPYDERGAWLLEADAAVCTAPDTLENRYAFRTRLTDAVWARVPVVCTRGGGMGDFVERRGIGLTVHPGDVEDCCSALRRVLAEDAQSDFRSRLEACRDLLAWEACTAPLVDFAETVARDPQSLRRDSRWQIRRRYLAYKVPSLWERVRG